MRKKKGNKNTNKIQSIWTPRASAGIECSVVALPVLVDEVCMCGVCGTCSLQVYTVGPDYAHAEARKSPALDGKVERDSEGKEIRYPVMLSAMEKLVARKVCLAFKVSREAYVRTRPT